MLFRTIKKTGDTGSLDRERVREAVIRLRDRKSAAGSLAGYSAEPSSRPLIAREEPRTPYGRTARGNAATAAKPGEGGAGQ